ncbi:TniB family NTP-binding protein [Pseudomonas sp. MMS21-TM103]|uniref:TniB family NTP-binding protein n=1 Tax=Pseudomonas sp. MMS21 TM103 TaxID=2886506 RepID=UPI001EDF20C3|nr:TniB family NTP-binding protein [Pseudomonas sp. MMS21 TM103]MCG4454965.1 TniB family NTP-binding protein [Pseudomonas sp. MMS21 TM103]
MTNSNTTVLNEFSTQIVLFPAFHHAYTMLQKSVETTQQRGVPNSAMVIGPSGSGKSTLCEIFRDSFGPTHEETYPDGVYTIRPAFYCSTPSPVTVKSFAKTVVQKLAPIGKPADLRGDTVELTFRMLELFKTCRIRVCEFDEFHYLVKPEAVKAKEIVVDWLITLINESHRSFVLAGTNNCLELLDERPALARRFPYVIELKYLSYSEDKASDYMILLSKLDEHIQAIANISGGSKLTDPDIAARLYVATSGNLEYIRMVIHGALQNALPHRSTGLNLADFKRAAALLDLKLRQFECPFDEPLSNCYHKIYDHNHEDT